MSEPLTRATTSPTDKSGHGSSLLRNSSKFKRLREQSKQRKTEETDPLQNSSSLNETIKLFGKLIESTQESPTLSNAKKPYLETVGELTPQTDSKKPRSGRESIPASYYLEPRPVPSEDKGAKDARSVTEPTMLNSSSTLMTHKAALTLRTKLEKMFVPSYIKKSLESKAEAAGHQSAMSKSTFQKAKARKPRLTIDTKDEDWGKSLSHRSIEKRGTPTPKTAQGKEFKHLTPKNAATDKKGEPPQHKPPVAGKKLSTPTVLKKEYTSTNHTPTLPIAPAHGRPSKLRPEMSHKASGPLLTDRDVGHQSSANLHTAFKSMGRRRSDSRQLRQISSGSRKAIGCVRNDGKTP